MNRVVLVGRITRDPELKMILTDRLLISRLRLIALSCQEVVNEKRILSIALFQ